MRRNPNAKPSAYFQQADVLDEPVLRDEQWLPTRLLAAFNEGLPDFAGAPVDLVNAGMGAVGLPVSDNPVLGSEWLRSGMNRLGIGQVTEGYALRSDVERYGQSIARGLGQSAIPAGGMIAGGGRLLLSTAPRAIAAANPVMTEKQREKSAALVTAAIMKNLSNKTWLSGISSMVEALDDPDRSAPALIARLSGSIAIPTGVAQIARTTDPILREACEPIDAIKARIPIVSKSLPARTDVWGRPIVNEGGLGPNIVSPIWVNTRRNDPVNKALLDLGVNIGRPSRPRVDGKSVDDDQFREYRNRAGQLTHGALLPYVTSPDWPSLAPEDQEDLVERLKRDARKEAKAGMFGAGR